MAGGLPENCDRERASGYRGARHRVQHGINIVKPVVCRRGAGQARDSDQDVLTDVVDGVGLDERGGVKAVRRSRRYERAKKKERVSDRSQTSGPVGSGRKTDECSMSGRQALAPFMPGV